MSIAGASLIAIWNDVTDEGRENFYQWHNREHMPERVAIPGFQRGRRYIAVEGTPEYFTLYEAETFAVLSGSDYFTRLNNPTPWTRAVVQTHFRNMSRGICRVDYSAGIGQGGFIATLQFGPRGNGEQLRKHLVQTALPPLLDYPGIAGVHLCIADRDGSSVEADEKKGQNVSIPNWLVLIEGVTAEDVKLACAPLRSGLAANGAEAEANFALYRLQLSRCNQRQ